MPIPKPNSGEKQKDYMSRCMGAIGGEYDDKKQAAAICHGKWRDSKMKNKADWHKLDFMVPISETMTQATTGDLMIKGIAIHAINTLNNVKFIAEELEPAAHTLSNKPILKDHINSVDAIVGKTSDNIEYDAENACVPFEGRIVDKEMQMKIKSGLVNKVSVGARVKDLVEDESDHSMVAKGIRFSELSLVACPADPDAGFGFEQAIMSSFKIKQEEAKDDEDDDDFDEESTKIQITNKEEGKVMETTNTVIPAPVTAAVAQPVAGQNDAFIKEIAELKEKVGKLEEAKKVAEKVDETKGKVSQEIETKTGNLLVESAETGNGFSVSRADYNDANLKRLRRY